jgi:Ni/Co efflux regulator RcnB
MGPPLYNGAVRAKKNKMRGRVVLMGASERKATYHLLLVLIGALVMGCLLVVVLMGPMAAAQADQQRPQANKVEQNNNKTVQVTAAGQNNYRVQGDDNPIVYKSADSRPSFDGGYYTHVLECPEGYKAIGGGFDLNTPDKGDNLGIYWQIQASDPVWADGKIGDAWTVEAYGHTRFFSKKLPTFTGYAACAPEDLISGLFIRYKSETTDFKKFTHKTIGVSCRRDERVIGGGFEFTGNNYLQLVRTERSRDDEHTWQAGAYLGERTIGHMRGWAVCVPSDALGATAYKEDAKSVPLAGRAVATTPGCPQGTYLLSGGAGMNNNAFDDPSEPLWSNSSPPNVKDPNPDNWKASAVQKERGAFTVHAFALCGRFADGGGG